MMKCCRDVIIANRGRYEMSLISVEVMIMLCRTFTTQTKKPGAEVVGRLPPEEEEEEEEARGGREVQEEDRERLTSRRETFVKLLRILLEKV